MVQHRRLVRHVRIPLNAVKINNSPHSLHFTAKLCTKFAIKKQLFTAYLTYFSSFSSTRAGCNSTYLPFDDATKNLIKVIQTRFSQTHVIKFQKSINALARIRDFFRPIRSQSQPKIAGEKMSPVNDTALRIDSSVGVNCNSIYSREDQTACNWTVEAPPRKDQPTINSQMIWYLPNPISVITSLGEYSVCGLKSSQGCFFSLTDNWFSSFSLRRYCFSGCFSDAIIKSRF